MNIDIQLILTIGTLVVGILTYIELIKPKPNVTCRVGEWSRPSNYKLVVGNTGKTKVRVLSILSNGKEIGTIPEWEKREFPFVTHPENEVSFDFYVTKDNSHHRPMRVHIRYKSLLFTRSKEFNV